MISLEKGLAEARTGDLWIFRGRTVVNKVMHAATNSHAHHGVLGFSVAGCTSATGVCVGCCDMEVPLK